MNAFTASTSEVNSIISLTARLSSVERIQIAQPNQIESAGFRRPRWLRSRHAFRRLLRSRRSVPDPAGPRLITCLSSAATRWRNHPPQSPPQFALPALRSLSPTMPLPGEAILSSTSDPIAWFDANLQLFAQGRQFCIDFRQHAEEQRKLRVEAEAATARIKAELSEAEKQLLHLTLVFNSPQLNRLRNSRPCAPRISQ